MKKAGLLLVLSLLIFSLGGCITATTHLKPRVDQEITGNRGYIVGEVPEVEIEKKFDKREVIEVEIEIPPFRRLFRR